MIADSNRVTEGVESLMELNQDLVGTWHPGGSGCLARESVERRNVSVRSRMSGLGQRRKVSALLGIVRRYGAVMAWHSRWDGRVGLLLWRAGSKLTVDTQVEYLGLTAYVPQMPLAAAAAAVLRTPIEPPGDCRYVHGKR